LTSNKSNSVLKIYILLANKIYSKILQDLFLTDLTIRVETACLLSVYNYMLNNKIHMCYSLCTYL